MKKHSSWITATCLISIPFAMVYLYRFGYSMVDKAYKTAGFTSNVDQQVISGQGINDSNKVIFAIIVLLLCLMVYSHKKQYRSSR